MRPNPFYSLVVLLTLLVSCNQAAPPELAPQATTVINDQASCMAAGGTYEDGGLARDCSFSRYTIAAGDVLELRSSATLASVRLRVSTNNGTLRVGSGLVATGDDLGNTGTIEIDGTLRFVAQGSNNGSLNVNNGGVLVVDPVSNAYVNSNFITVKRGGTLNVQNSIVNLGFVDIESGGVLNNNRDFSNRRTLSVAGGGTLNNESGSLFNSQATSVINLACGSVFKRGANYFGNEPVVPADCIPPSVTVEQAAAQADPTITSPVFFTAIFSERINETTLVRADFSVTGTAGATLELISGNSTNIYTLTLVPATPGTISVSLPAGVITDLAGNPNSASTSTDNTVTFGNPDATAPTITLTTPSEGASYKLKQKVNAAYICTDEGSGVATCTGTVANGVAIDTASVGQKSFTVAASDNAGNTSSKSVTYKVIYDFKGFFYPVKNAPALNSYKAGLLVPFTFTLGGNYGKNVLSSVKSVPINCTTLTPLGSSSRESTNLSTQADSRSLSAESTTIYLYLWGTQRAWKGTCREFTLTLNDGTDHKANFKFN